jgi:hypothetical protein
MAQGGSVRTTPDRDLANPRWGAQTQTDHQLPSKRDTIMRVFITRATGFIGSAVVRELLEAEHHVVGLARSDTAAAALTAGGAEVHRGALDDLGRRRRRRRRRRRHSSGFQQHLRDNGLRGRGPDDLRAVETIGAALEGFGKPFVVTSGTFMLATLGRLATEADVADPALPRVAAENAAIALAQRGVRSSVVRLAPSVHAFVSWDNPTSSALTQKLLGWRAEGPALIPDIEQGHYFND